jgi:hypothetical protein
MGILPASDENFDGGLMSRDDFNKLASVPAGSSLVVHGRTQVIDFLAGAADYLLSLPVMAGKELVGVVGRARFVAKTGTALTAVAWQVGNNATFDNFVPAANGGLAAATINANAVGNVIALNAGLTAVDMSTTQMKVRVTSSPTGVTVFTGYIQYAAMYSTIPT